MTKDNLPFDFEALKQITPVVDQLDIIDVNFASDPTYLDLFVESLCSEYNFELSLRGSNMIVDVQEFRSYLLALLEIRIRLVRGLPYPKVQVYIPAFFNNLLSSVGVVIDSLQSVKLVPHIELTDIDVDALKRMSNVVYQLGRIGFEYSSEMPRDKKGHWELMSSVFLDGVVKTACNTHPGYVLATAILAQRGVEAILSPRVKYAPSVFVDACFRTVCSPKRAKTG